MIKNNIIFFHIPKCGGTSIEKSLSDQFGRDHIKFPATVLDYLDTPPQYLINYKVLAGHITHDLALPYINDESVLITMFRSPLKRIRSLYNYFLNLNDGSIYYDLANSLTFSEWLYSNHPSVLVNIQNAMIRQFTPESYWDVNRSANPQLIFSYAIKFLKKFHIIGFLDEYDNFIFNLNKSLYLNLPSNVILNKSLEDMTSAVSDFELCQWMSANSSLDLEFYDYAKSL